MNYTKGEWKAWWHDEIDEYESDLRIRVNGTDLAIILTDNTQEAEANAQLIASAPDLYEALNKLYKAYLRVTTMPDEASREAIKALAKAEGK